MDFSTQLDALQKRVAEARAEVTAATTETRDQLKQRIDQAQVDVNLGLKDANQRSRQPPTRRRASGRR